MMWDHRVRPLLFDGIALQEFDPKAGKLVGARKNIFQGTDLKLVEGPHLYKRNGWYYLLTAEGGTGYEHACTFARSRTIDGPYELHPEKYIVTAKDAPFNAVQRAGPRRHRRDARRQDLLRPPDGPADRPVHGAACSAARPAIQEAEWRDDGWLWLKNGRVPSLEVDVPGTRDDDSVLEPSSATRSTARCTRTSSGSARPSPSASSSRAAASYASSAASRSARGSSRRWSRGASAHFSFDAETTLDFSPTDERQFAGPHALLRPLQLPLSHGHRAFRRQARTADHELARDLRAARARWSTPADPCRSPTRARCGSSSRSAARTSSSSMPSARRMDRRSARSLDASLISDEKGQNGEHGSFTGGFVGVAASDLNGTALPADFCGLRLPPGAARERPLLAVGHPPHSWRIPLPTHPALDVVSLRATGGNHDHARLQSAGRNSARARQMELGRVLPQLDLGARQQHLHRAPDVGALRQPDHDLHPRRPRQRVGVEEQARGATSTTSSACRRHGRSGASSPGGDRRHWRLRRFCIFSIVRHHQEQRALSGRAGGDPGRPRV